MKNIFWLLPCFIAAAICGRAQVSVTQTSLSYFQDFNTIDTSSSNAHTNMPVGWYFYEHGASGNNKYRGGNGSLTTNDSYSFGNTQSTERAFGTVGGGTIDTLMYGVLFQNNVGADVNVSSISFKEEQWRSGDTTAAYTDSVQVFYSFNADSVGDNAATWTEIPSLLMTSIVLDQYAVALNGDNVFSVKTASPGIVFPAGKKLWLRWRDWNSRGSDDALALDSLSVQFGTLRPIITAVTPVANTVTVPAPLPQLTILFDQAVQKGTGVIIIKNETDQTFQTIAASSGNVTVAGNKVTITNATIQYLRTYHILFDSTAFYSIPGYTCFGMYDSSAWRFSTRSPTGINNATKGYSTGITVLGRATPDAVSLLVNTAHSGISTIIINDIAGRKVYETATMLTEGTNNILLTPKNLPPGMYIIRLYGKEESGIVKCVVGN